MDLEQLQLIVGQNLKKIREKKDYTQLKAAEECGYDERRFQRFEAGEINMTLKTLLHLAEGLDVPVEELVRTHKKR